MGMLSWFRRGKGSPALPVFMSRASNPLVLDPSRAEEFRSMIETAFRTYGPTKSKVDLSIGKVPQLIEASIDAGTWDVEIKLDRKLHFKPHPELRAYMDASNITDPIKEMIGSVSFHEMGHWEFPRGKRFGCPYDRPTHYTAFVDPAYKVLVVSKRFKPQVCQALSGRVANMVTDLINNFNVAHSLEQLGKNFKGQILFWYLQGQKNGKFGNAYELFVKLNLALFGSSEDHRLLGRFMRGNPKVDEAVSRLVPEFTRNRIYNKKDWPLLTEVYTQEVLPFLEIPPPRHATSAEHDSQSSSERISKTDAEQIMERRTTAGSGENGIPFYLQRTIGLDAYYRMLAKRIPVKSDEGALPSSTLPIIPLTFQPYDPEVHSPEDAVLSRIIPDLVGRRFVPGVIKSRLSVPVQVSVGVYSLPDCFLVVMDSSVSMMGPGNTTIVPWGDKSYYHFGILTYYGLLRFFELEGVLHRIKFGGAIFSDETYTAKDFEEVKKLLLNPATGGTRLDLRKFITAFRNASGAIFPFISDGGIYNWDLIRADFIEFARRNYFFMIQIGGDSQTSRDLKAAGLSVYHVDSPEEVFRLAVDLTVKNYGLAIIDKLSKQYLMGDRHD